MQSWVPVKDAERLAVAVYPFLGSGPHQIPFSIGDTLHILQRCGAWYFGYAINNHTFRGIFPCRFVHIKRCVVDKSLKGYGTVIARENPLLHEVTSVLREWGHMWKQLYVTRDPALKPVSDMLHELIRQRRKIVAGTLPTDELRQLKRRVAATVDRGNELLKLDLVVRDEQGNILNPDLTSAVKLYRHHQQAAKRSQAQNTEGERVPKRTQQTNSHCLYVTVKNCVCRLDEDAEIILSVCDASDPNRLKVLTEPYVVPWKEGFEINLDQMNSLRVLYTDLSNSDIASERLFLVAYVVRVGSSSTRADSHAGRRSTQISHKPAKKTVEMCRRPVGAAAIDLASAFASANGDHGDKERFMPIMLCSDKDSLEDTARRLVRDIGARDPKGQVVVVTLRLLHGEKEQHPHLAKTALARRLGFPDVILPTDVRNDLYLTLLGGEFARANKVQERNVEVTVKVCNRDGSVRSGVIERGAGWPPVEEYRSVVYWHENRPRWAETIKVVLPIEGDCDSHVRFTFKHRSNNEMKDKAEKPFGLAYVKLLQADGTTLRDTRHELCVYKINAKNYEEGDNSYLELPALKAGVRDGQPRPESGPYHLSLRDSFNLESVTCSTKLTQDVDLLGLLNWTSDPESLKERLSRLGRIKQEEIVKFLRDSLDALFHILIKHETDDMYDIDVFNALVTIISSVTTERRYQHFQPVLEAYLQSAFSATIVDRKLMGVLQTYIDEVRLPESRLHLLKALGCLRYVFKFIIKSRQLFLKMNGCRDAAAFEDSMQTLLRSFTGLMRDRDAELENVQEAVLQHLPAAVDDLNSVCDPIQLSQTMAELIEVLAEGGLTEPKLSVISRLVHSQLFLQHDCRRVLLPKVVSAVGRMFDLQQQNGAGGMATLRLRNKRNQKLKQMLGEQRIETMDVARDELRRSQYELQLCIDILSDVLDVLWRQHGQRGGTSSDVSDVMLELLRKVIQTVIGVDRDDSLVCGLVAVLISMLRQMEKHHYDQYMSKFTDVTDELHFITEILMVFRDLISKCVYPPLWCEMIMLQNSVMLKSLRLFSYTIRDRFLDPFEYQIWNNFFHCAISFLTQSPLQLENFCASKRTRLLARYKDMRKATAQEIRTMWISLGQHKISFVPSLVGPFLEMTLVPDPELRAMTIPLFFDMMQCEFYSSVEPGTQYIDTKRQASASKCNFQEFEHEMINKLDHLVEGGRGDEYYRELFRERMLDLCEKHSSMREQGVRFVMTVTDLMKRLLEYRAIMRDENEENKMSCTVNLLHFYYDIHCQEMYIRYLYKLCALHLQANNFIEAGFTLKLHADQLQWSDEQLPAVLRHTSTFGPLETHRAMKEALYNSIIDYFDKGNLWEAALHLCKELSGQYEEATFDYHRLSQLLQRMSRLYDKILQEIRPVPNYFRVAFYGRGFPAFLQNKVYVYRGRGFERLAEFSSRVQATFPKAELMETLETPGPEVTESLQQHAGAAAVLQVNSVEPDMEDNKRFSGKPVTEKIVQYYRVNDVDRFVYSRRSQRGAKDPDNPFASMWLERTVMRTSSRLPGILAWYPVTTSQTHDVTPLENAIETMTTKNRQLRELVLSSRNDAAQQLNPLTQTLSGIISPAVMGGTANYETFFTPEYLERNPDDAPKVAKLKVSIAKQIPLLEAGLETHGQRAPDNLKPLQEMLEQKFDDMRADVQARFGVQECDLPYHRPVMSLRHHRPSLPTWERQDSIMSDLHSPNPLLGSAQNGQPFLSLMNLSPNFSGSGTLKSQKSTSTLPRSKTIFYSQSSNLSGTSSGSSTPTRGRERKDHKRSSISSQLSDASTIILSEELPLPSRPLRSEVERERRLTRPYSGQYTLRHSPSTSTLSSRDSIGLSMDDEQEPPPPPLPDKRSRQVSLQPEPDGQDGSSPQSQEPLSPDHGEPPPPPPKPPLPTVGESSV